MIREVSITHEKIPTQALVISGKDNKNTPAKDPPVNIEAAFRIAGNRGLRLNTSNWDQQASHFFSARTASDPENLLNHVQRIMHHIQLKNTDGAYGALLDLFIVLKHRGRPLKERMLQYTTPLLQQQQYARLQRLLDNKTWDMFSLAGSNGSVLCSGLDGSQALVERNLPTSDSRYNQLNEARSYLQNGQLTAAKKVLESAVVDGCTETDMHNELIDLYRRTHDKTGFLKIYPQLKHLQQPLTALWQQLNSYFAADNS